MSSQEAFEAVTEEDPPTLAFKLDFEGIHRYCMIIEALRVPRLLGRTSEEWKRELIAHNES